MSVSDRWARTWPALLGTTVVASVGAPAAIASWRHARSVIERSGDPVMAPWLALSTDGMLLAALVVIWVRRHRGEAAGFGPWAAFWAGMLATVAANLAARGPGVEGFVVALWPPVCLAIALELVALIAYRTRPPQDATGETLVVEAEIVQDDEPVTTELACAGGEAGDDLVTRARKLVAAGAGRPKLVSELGVTDHQAKQLMKQVQEEVAA